MKNVEFEDLLIQRFPVASHRAYKTMAEAIAYGLLSCENFNGSEENLFTYLKHFYKGDLTPDNRDNMKKIVDMWGKQLERQEKLVKKDAYSIADSGVLLKTCNRCKEGLELSKYKLNANMCKLCREVETKKSSERYNVEHEDYRNQEREYWANRISVDIEGTNETLDKMIIETTAALVDLKKRKKAYDKLKDFKNNY